MRLLPILLMLSCTSRVATIAVNDNIAIGTVQQVDKPLFRLGAPFGDVSNPVKSVKPEIDTVEGLNGVDLCIDHIDHIDQGKGRSEGRRATLKATVRIDTVVREVEICIHDTVCVVKEVENKSGVRNALIVGVISSVMFLVIGYYLRGRKVE